MRHGTELRIDNVWIKILNQSTGKVQDTDRGMRIRAERERLGLSLVEFGKKTGVSKGSQILYEKGNAPTVDYLTAAGGAGADIFFILTGKRGQDTKPSHAAGSPTDFDQPGMVSIPRYDEVRPSAGPGAVAVAEVPSTRVAFERHWLIDIGVQPDAAVILPAQGDSMSPTIPNGAPMLVDTSKREVRNGFIYVFNIDGDLVVKRIERLPDGTFDLISDNRNYPTRNLSRDTVTSMMVIGRVYAAVSKF